jgi:hypothetical protein
MMVGFNSRFGLFADIQNSWAFRNYLAELSFPMAALWQPFSNQMCHQNIGGITLS